MDPCVAAFILLLVAPIYYFIYSSGKFFTEKYNIIEDVGLRVINATIAKISYNTYELQAMVDEYNSMREKLIELGVLEWSVMIYSTPTDKIVTKHRAISRAFVAQKIKCLMGGILQYSPDMITAAGRYLGLPEHMIGGIFIQLLKFI